MVLSFKSWLTYHSSHVHNFDYNYYMESKLHTQLDECCIYHIKKIWHCWYYHSWNTDYLLHHTFFRDTRYAYVSWKFCAVLGMQAWLAMWRLVLAGTQVDGNFIQACSQRCVSVKRMIYLLPQCRSLVLVPERAYPSWCPFTVTTTQLLDKLHFSQSF